MREFTNQEIAEIRRNLNNDVVYVGVKNGKATIGRIYHSAYPSKFIAFEYYGQSAVKDTNEQVRWLLETIFEDCDNIVEAVWSDYHVSYIPIDGSYEPIDLSGSHPNVFGV